MSSLHLLEERLAIRFRERSLLEQALVHRSYLNENPDFHLGSNERLEFLGDALLGLVTSHELYMLCPDLSEGELTALRSALIRGRTLARLGDSLQLGSYLLLGQGEDASGGRQRQTNLANVFEAILGALFLDQGYQVAREFILRIMAPEIELLLKREIPKDPKSRLQETLQARNLSAPSYRIVDISGPDHSRLFTVEVIVDSRVLGRGVGKRKIDAEGEAAKEALKLLEG